MKIEAQNLSLLELITMVEANNSVEFSSIKSSAHLADLLHELHMSRKVIEDCQASILRPTRVPRR